MTIRKIAELGHPVLRRRAREVRPDELASPEIQRLIDDLVETMRDACGAGLAAPQIHESVRIVAIEVAKNPRYPYKPDIPLTILVNPVLTPRSAETFENIEGCLSIPGLRGLARRHAEIAIDALDRDGRPLHLEARGVSAGVYQHECDHLDGVLFLERADPRSLATLGEWERHHRAEQVERALAVVARYGA